jgi:hypothetical protein
MTTLFVLDEFIICQEISTNTSNLKNTIHALIDLKSNPPKRAQSAVDTLF